MKITQYISSKKQFSLGTVLKLFEVVFEVLIPVFMSMIIDDVTSGGISSLTYWLFGIILSFGLFGFLTTYLSHKIIAKVSLDFAKNIRGSVFSSVMQFTHEEKHQLSTTTIINRMNNDVITLQNALGMSMRIASRAPFLMIASIIAIMIVSIRLGSIMLIGYVFLAVVIGLLAYILIVQFRQVQLKRDQADRIARENISGVRIIRAYANHENEEKRYANQVEQLFQVQKKTSYFAALTSPLAILVLNSFLVIIIYFAGLEVNVGNLSTGQVVLVINYTAQLLTATIALLNLTQLYARSAISYERIKRLLTANTKKYCGHEKFKNNSIELKDTTYIIATDGMPIINDVSVKINAGEKIGVVGETGSGKSYVLKLIAGLVDCSSGKLLIGGISSNQISHETFRENIGYVSQQRTLIAGDVRFNVAMGRNISDDEITSALKNVNLGKGENFLNYNVLEKGSNLSGGQSQRINIARAIAGKPSIILLDDVFSALDSHSTTVIKNNIFSLSDKPTIIIASQNVKPVIECDKIMVLKEGQLIGFDSHKMLLQTCSYYRQLYELSGGVAHV